MPPSTTNFVTITKKSTTTAWKYRPHLGFYFGNILVAPLITRLNPNNIAALPATAYDGKLIDENSLTFAALVFGINQPSNALSSIPIWDSMLISSLKLAHQ